MGRTAPRESTPDSVKTRRHLANRASECQRRIRNRAPPKLGKAALLPSPYSTPTAPPGRATLLAEPIHLTTPGPTNARLRAPVPIHGDACRWDGLSALVPFSAVDLGRVPVERRIAHARHLGAPASLPARTFFTSRSTSGRQRAGRDAGAPRPQCRMESIALPMNRSKVFPSLTPNISALLNVPVGPSRADEHNGIGERPIGHEPLDADANGLVANVELDRRDAWNGPKERDRQQARDPPKPPGERFLGIYVRCHLPESSNDVWQEKKRVRKIRHVAQSECDGPTTSLRVVCRFVCVFYPGQG